jgi:hypothetical protein
MTHFGWRKRLRKTLPPRRLLELLWKILPWFKYLVVTVCETQLSPCTGMQYYKMSVENALSASRHSSWFVGGKIVACELVSRWVIKKCQFRSLRFSVDYGTSVRQLPGTQAKTLVCDAIHIRSESMPSKTVLYLLWYANHYMNMVAGAGNRHLVVLCSLDIIDLCCFFLEWSCWLRHIMRWRQPPRSIRPS